MSEVLGVSGYSSGCAAEYAAFAGANRALPSPPAHDTLNDDIVELSARATSTKRSTPRDSLVEDVRRRIADGTYLSADKISVAVERLLEAIRE